MRADKSRAENREKKAASGRTPLSLFSLDLRIDQSLSIIGKLDERDVCRENIAFY